jgi:transposase
MQIFNYFIGIDVSKDKLDIYHSSKGQLCPIQNSKKDISAFIKTLQPQDDLLVVIDLTGGYELIAADLFYSAGFNVHRAEGRRVKAFARSFGQLAKTDPIDAGLLAEYGDKMQSHLRLYKPEDRRLTACVERLVDLKSILQQERNRIQAPNLIKPILKSLKSSIKYLEHEIGSLEQHAHELVSENKELKGKYEVLKAVSGIGENSALMLVVLLPELGHVNRRAIAALGGVAPYAHDSGKLEGHRTTRCGRRHVKSTLFMCALSARRYNAKMKVFADRLSLKAKAKRVVLTAVMRKLLISVNAKCKDFLQLG